MRSSGVGSGSESMAIRRSASMFGRCWLIQASQLATSALAFSPVMAATVTPSSGGYSFEVPGQLPSLELTGQHAGPERSVFPHRPPTREPGTRFP